MSAAAYALVSIAILLLSVLLLWQGVLADYGIFAALQLLQGLMWGVLSSVIIAPLLLRWSADSALLTPFVLLGLLLCLGFALINVAAVTLLDDTLSYEWVALSSFLHCWRWLLRSIAQLAEQHLSVILSDTITGITVVIFCLWCFLFTPDATYVDINTIFAVMACSGLLGTIMFKGMPLLNWTALKERTVWRNCIVAIRQQGQPALSGTFAAEFAANAHSYIAAFFYGPLAFAPIAAATLLFRPQTVIQQNLQQTERVALRQAITTGCITQVLSIMKRFIFTLKVVFFVNFSAMLWVVFSRPEWLWSDESTLWQWQLGCGFMSAIILLRVWRSAYTMVLQAADMFSVLAKLAWLATGLMLLLSLFILSFADVVWCLAVVLLIEIGLFVKYRALVQNILQQRLAVEYD